jgi:hypothetical protein
VPLVGAHAAAAVEQEENALVALVLELAHDGRWWRSVAFQSMWRSGSPLR